MVEWVQICGYFHVKWCWMLNHLPTVSLTSCSNHGVPNAGHWGAREGGQGHESQSRSCLGQESRAIKPKSVSYGAWPQNFADWLVILLSRCLDPWSCFVLFSRIFSAVKHSSFDHFWQHVIVSGRSRCSKMLIAFTGMSKDRDRQNPREWSVFVGKPHVWHIPM